MKDLKKLIEELKADGKITEEELRKLHREIMWDGQCTEEEKTAFTELFKQINRGSLQRDFRQLD